MASPALAQSQPASFSLPAVHVAMMTMPKCKSSDPVVWINTRSKVYYMKGAAYYGKTSKGKYACMSAAVAMGAHAPGMSHKMTSGSMAPHSMMSPSSMASPGAMNPPNPQPSMGISSPLPHMSSSPSP
ncbi:MAG: hypothetical protein IAI50_00490 [Candidatus Eremiobacteraeota bacterium]|nr:hypothetical protein [Candidatus Eremiobacteraeota bacterium]